MKQLFLFSLISLLASVVVFAQSRYGCQNVELTGEYLLITDSDGTTPRDDATITLILTGNTAQIHAVMTDVDITSDGSFSACQNLITISFVDFDFAADNDSFKLVDNMLTLPFIVLGGVEYGTSTWKRISGGENSEDETNNDPNLGPDPDNGGENGNNGSNENGNGSNNGNTENNSGTLDPDDPNNPSPYADFNLDDIEDEYKDYVGQYVGIGFGYEVRFKHTAGAFASQFTGVEENDLPFEGDKVIMTLLVEHGVMFDIYVDKDGQITGTGEITYNVIPNLCGVAMLTEQVNSAVNLMGELTFFYDLGKNIGQASVKSFTGTFLGMSGDLGKYAKIAATSGKSINTEILGTVIPNKIKGLNVEGKQQEALCQCAAGNPTVTGGSSVGPATIKEMILTTGVDIAKGIFMDMSTMSPPVGMLLSIPGVTQIQYYYKGLQNGPETRTFDITGYLMDGQMYLDMDGAVRGGPEDLTIEYMVNYQKETPTFPIWSPFLQEPASIHPAGEDFTIYERVEKKKTVKYENAATGKQEEFTFPYYETEEKTTRMPVTFGTFHEAGQHRNGVSVWHEYEYYWDVYKTKPAGEE